MDTPPTAPLEPWQMLAFYREHQESLLAVVRKRRAPPIQVLRDAAGEVRTTLTDFFLEGRKDPVVDHPFAYCLRCLVHAVDEISADAQIESTRKNGAARKETRRLSFVRWTDGQRRAREVLCEIVREEVARLPEIQREVLRRIYWDNLDYQSIGDLLGMKKQQVADYARAGRHRLFLALQSVPEVVQWRQQGARRRESAETSDGVAV